LVAQQTLRGIDGFSGLPNAGGIATTFSYVNPIVAMTLGWALYGEPLT
jgi:hypothetical protein